MLSLFSRAAFAADAQAKKRVFLAFRRGPMAPIHIAARRCDVEAIRRELQRGVDPNLTEGTSVNKTPLQLIQIPMLHEGRQAQVKALNCFRVLLENGASVDVRDVINDTRLHDACLHNNPAIAALLVEFGADVDARNNTSNTPLHRTTCFGSVESARVLLRAGAEVNARNSVGATPLQQSLSDVWNNYNSRIYPILLGAGAEIPAEADHPYVQKVINAGGWANYERQHLDRLTLMLTPKDDGRRRSRRRLSPLRRLPPEVLRKIAAFAFHAGYY